MQDKEPSINIKLNWRSVTIHSNFDFLRYEPMTRIFKNYIMEIAMKKMSNQLIFQSIFYISIKIECPNESSSLFRFAFYFSIFSQSRLHLLKNQWTALH